MRNPPVLTGSHLASVSGVFPIPCAPLCEPRIAHLCVRCRHGKVGRSSARRMRHQLAPPAQPGEIRLYVAAKGHRSAVPPQLIVSTAGASIRDRKRFPPSKRSFGLVPRRFLAFWKSQGHGAPHYDGWGPDLLFHQRLLAQSFDRSQLHMCSPENEQLLARHSFVKSPSLDQPPRLLFPVCFRRVALFRLSRL